MKQESSDLATRQLGIRFHGFGAVESPRLEVVRCRVSIVNKYSQFPNQDATTLAHSPASGLTDFHYPQRFAPHHCSVGTSSSCGDRYNLTGRQPRTAPTPASWCLSRPEKNSDQGLPIAYELEFPPNNGVARIAAVGMEVGEAYSQAIEQVLSHPELGNWEYLLTIEHDNVPPQDGVIRLLESMEANPNRRNRRTLLHQGIRRCSANLGRSERPGSHFRPQLPDPNGGLVECNGTGMGFNLWRMKMFKKKLRRPWFVTQKKDGMATQDLYFAADAKKHGYRFAVDCSVRVGHYDQSTDIMF